MQSSIASNPFESALRSNPKTAFHQQILDKICVQAPYNRVQDLAASGAHGVEARVSFEAPPGFESGPLASAEIGRHLAILGSCALARNNASERRHYYLAQQALLRRFETAAASEGEALRMVAIPVGNDSAEVVLTNHREQTVATLSVSYRVLSDRLFARLFRGQRRVTPAAVDGQSPYATPVVFEQETQELDSATALLREVTPELCQGHFDDYPALPVAILMDGINRLATSHLDRTLAKNFRLTTCAVSAERLAFAGESVEFSVKRTLEERQSVIYHGVARRAGDETVFGEATLTYELLDRTSGFPPSGVQKAESVRA